MTKTCRAADPHPSRAFDANETSTTNVDDAFAALDAAARKGRPPPGTLDPSNPVPAPVSRDVRIGIRDIPGISSSGSEPASSESTASRAYREALRVMLPPDARARAAAREPTTGTTGTIAPGSASARSHPRVSPGFPRRSFDATSSAGHISGTATGTHHTKTSSRNVSRSDASPSPGTSSTKTSPSPSGEPARETPGHPPRSRAPTRSFARRRRSAWRTPPRSIPRGDARAHRRYAPPKRRRRRRRSRRARGVRYPSRVGTRRRVVGTRAEARGSRVLGARPAAASATTSRVSSRRRVGSEVRVATEVGRAKICSVQSGSGGGETRDERLATRRRRSNGKRLRGKRLRERRRQPPRSTRAARLGFTRGSPRVVDDETRGARYTHVVLAVDVFVFFSGRFAGASNVGLRPRRIRRRGPPRAEPRDDGGGARARRRWSNAPIARDDHDSRRGPIPNRTATTTKTTGPRPRTSDSSLVCFFVRFAPRTARATSRISARCVARCWRGVPRRVRPRWCPCRRTCGPSWPSWAGSNPSTTCQPPRKPPRG